VAKMSVWRLTKLRLGLLGKGQRQRQLGFGRRGGLVSCPFRSIVSEHKSSSVKPRLTYFNARVLAEASRMILVEANVPFDDIRVRHLEPSVRSKCTFGQVPLYEDGEFTLVQSRAIGRYLATKHGLRGPNDETAAIADMVVDGVYDLLDRYTASFRSLTDPNQREEAKTTFAQSDLPAWLLFFEQHLIQFGEYYAGHWTWADLVVFSRFADLVAKFPQAFVHTPQVKAHLERVANRPRIAAWIKTRPKTDA